MGKQKRSGRVCSRIVSVYDGSAVAVISSAVNSANDQVYQVVVENGCVESGTMVEFNIRHWESQGTPKVGDRVLLRGIGKSYPDNLHYSYGVTAINEDF